MQPSEEGRLQCKNPASLYVHVSNFLFFFFADNMLTSKRCLNVVNVGANIHPADIFSPRFICTAVFV